MAVWRLPGFLSWSLACANAEAPRRTLQDDPAFQRKNYQENIEKDAECNRSPLWGPFRVQLLQTEEDMRVELAYEKMMEWGLENVTKVDEESKVCLLGLVSMQYYFAHMLLFEIGSVEAAADAFRMVDEHSGALHPDLLDKAAGYGKIWPISADGLDGLRRALLKASSGGGRGGPERRRRFKNAFGLHDEDWSQVWGSWRPRGDPLERLSRPWGAAQSGAPKPSFRVFVYDPDSIPALRALTRGGSFCKHNQWGMEVALHDWFLACPCRTDNPEEADFFFVPHYTSCLINHADTFEGCDTKQLCGPTTELFQQVLSSSQHYRRVDGGAGRDHIFVWGSGMAADGPFATWRDWVPNAIFMMTEPELWNPYKEVVLASYTPYKDILVPGRITVDDMIGLGKMAKPVEERSVLGHFIGWPRPPHPSVMPPEQCQNSSCPLNVRSVLLAKKGDEMLHVDVDVPYVESFMGLTSSLFCFVPRGKSAWSSRFFQTFFAGCIPVLLNDRYEPPFGEIVDLPKAVIKWPMTEVDALVDYLKQLVVENSDRMVELREAGRELRCWYAWPPSWVEWSWLEMNKSKFNKTCQDWHLKNAYVAVTRLLATKAGRGRGRFYWPGAVSEALETPGAL